MTRQDNRTRWRAKGLWVGRFAAACACLHTAGGEQQENRGPCRQVLASRHDRPAQADRPQTPVSREHRKPLSTRAKGFQKAGEGIRTLDVQLGKTGMGLQVAARAVVTGLFWHLNGPLMRSCG